MIPKYNIFFVPHLKNKKKISPLRASICKQVHSTQALQFPIHMSLISGGFKIKNYSKFENELKILCNMQNPMELEAEKSTSIIADRFWTGIHIKQTNHIKQFQIKLQELRNKFADKVEKHYFHPLHITLAFPAKVENLKPIKCPVKILKFDRITIAKKEKENAPYRIYKHIKLTSL